MAFLLHQLLTESAARFPDREAVVRGDERVTYAVLDRETNRLCHQLGTLDVEKGDRVGIHMTRGIPSVTAALAVLKAGAAYVPIDPLAPAPRIRHIVERCRIRVLLTTHDRLPGLAEALPAGAAPVLIAMGPATSAEADTGSMRVIDWTSAAGDFGTDPTAVEAADCDLAYILFTSGSTGTPKGVMLTHRNALTFVESTGDFFAIGPDDRLSNVCPLHFDMSVFDIYVALRAGACVVVIPEEHAFFPARLARTIVEGRVSVWNSVPSVLTPLAAMSDPTRYDWSALRLILFAGEVFPRKHLDRLREAIPSARFCNMYGQTEANSSTYFWVEPGGPDVTLPIGKAFPNFEVFALDPSGRAVREPGVEGELYVRSSTVGLGYWEDDERTASAFVTDPRGTGPAPRVYRTGDLVQLDAEDNYVFVGRKDHMIKSRGHRVELGEVEAVISGHPQVANVAVIPIPDELLGNRIAAVVVPLPDSGIGSADILQHCVSQLPRYMVPDRVELWDVLPSTSSGKVDRTRTAQLLTDEPTQ